MVFSFYLTVPSNTPKTAQIRKRLKLTRGVLWKLDIFFPPGSAGLTHIHIDEALHQVFPLNPDGDFSGNNVVFSGEVYYKLEREPYELDLWGWNTDDTYAHTVFVTMWVMPEVAISYWDYYQAYGKGST